MDDEGWGEREKKKNRIRRKRMRWRKMEDDRRESRELLTAVIFAASCIVRD